VGAVALDRRGHLVPFVMGSIPMAFVGGSLVLPGAVYKPLVGLSLLLAAFQLVRTAASSAATDERPPATDTG
jgi:uncharacterized membrane protein YfcA